MKILTKNEYNRVRCATTPSYIDTIKSTLQMALATVKLVNIGKFKLSELSRSIKIKLNYLVPYVNISRHTATRMTAVEISFFRGKLDSIKDPEVPERIVEDPSVYSDITKVVSDTLGAVPKKLSVTVTSLGDGKHPPFIVKLLYIIYN